MYKRRLELNELLKKKSFFLFGPRSTGKTSLIKTELESAKIYDLLDSDVFRTLVKKPKVIEEWILSNSETEQIIVIDEVQKLPSILDEVHRLLSNYQVKFLLTGSSARKLKRGSVNLLAGRAWEANLFPLVSVEIDDFDLTKYLNCGGLPQVYLSKHPAEELRSYVSSYLQEEVYQESLTRNLPAFSNFLEAIALSNGQEINYQSLASDCGVSPKTLKNYIEILNDTLLGFELKAFTKTTQRKAISRAKYYLFDIGITNHLCHRGNIKEKSELFGNAFEHFIILEVLAWNNYERKFFDLNYWRSTSQFEVDLIINNEVAVEIKATDLVQNKHLKGLRALKEEKLLKKYIVVSQDHEKRTTEDGIQIYPWKDFLKELWLNKLV